MNFGKAIAYSLLIGLLGCQFGKPEESSQLDDDEVGNSVARTVHLDEAAQAAVDVQTAIVASQPLPEVMQLTGWLVAIPGKESVIKARGTGVFETQPERAELGIGATVTSGERLGSLRTVLTPQEETQLVLAKEEADVLMNQALVSKKLAENQLRGIEQSDANNAVAGSRLLELRETIARNDIAYQEARDKLSYLPNEPYADEIQLRPVAVTAPLSGRISAVNVVSNQLVIQGDPLWTVSDWTQLWVKAPVFVDDLHRIPAGLAASMRWPGSPVTVAATPVDVPLPATVGRRTSDKYYLVENADGKLRPGQAVELELPMSEPTSQLVVPRSAIVWDGVGRAWVYVKVEEDEFSRRQVKLGHGNRELISVIDGVREGDEIVVQGAQSLYGEEFKSQLQAEDDD